MSTAEPVYYGHRGANKKCPDYKGVLIFLVSSYDKAPFGTVTKCVDYAVVLIFKCRYTGFTVYLNLCSYAYLFRVTT